MNQERPLIIRPLDPAVHDRGAFDCGERVLNEYLAKRARKEGQAGVAACFVASETSSPSVVLGYYTLSSAVISLSRLPEKWRKKLPGYGEMPATLLGRMAVAQHVQGCGIGGRLLVSAMERSLNAAAEVASLALVTDPKDENAGAFYRGFGFQELDASRLFMRMHDIELLLKPR